MENTSFRNNGIKFNSNTLTDSEVENILVHSLDRANRFEGELSHIVGIAASRGLVSLDSISDIVPQAFEPGDAA